MPQCWQMCSVTRHTSGWHLLQGMQMEGATLHGYASTTLCQSGVLYRYSPFNWPAQTIQSYAGECPSYSVDCLTLQDQTMLEKYTFTMSQNATMQLGHYVLSHLEKR